MDKTFNMISAGFFAVCGFLWGKMDGLFYALIAFMVLDYITGIISAYIAEKLSSAVGFVGIARKVFMLVLVAVGHILDVHILGNSAVCRSAVIGFYIANEGLSILENAGKIGLPLPRKILDVLEQLRKNEISHIIGEIFVDDISELPTPTGIDGYELIQGSIAYIIKSGELFIMDSDGVWHTTNGEAVSNESA